MNTGSMNLALLLCGVASAACSSPNPIDSGADSALDAAADTGIQPDASDASDAAVQPPGLWLVGGEVSATHADFGGGPALSAAAAFWNEASGGTGVVCTYRIEGVCTIRVCTPTGSSNAPTAGDVAMSVNGSPRLTLTPGANGLYASAGAGVTAWAPGDQVTFAAQGADMPAFNVALTAPQPLTVMAPSPGAASVPVSRVTGFTARWASGDGTVRISIRQQRQIGTSALQGGVATECFFPRSAGTGTVPAAALSDFDAASGGAANAEVLVFAVSAAGVMAGSASILAMVNEGGVYTAGIVQ